jgi:hypothetical protein
MNQIQLLNDEGTALRDFDTLADALAFVTAPDVDARIDALNGYGCRIEGWYFIAVNGVEVPGTLVDHE